MQLLKASENAEVEQRFAACLGGKRGQRGWWMTIDLQKTVQALWHGKVLWGCPMARYSTLRAGGSAAALVEPGSITELADLLRELADKNLQWLVVGGGSNILVSDHGFAGVVLHLGREFAAISSVAGEGDEVLVTVEAGCSLARLVKWCLEQELTGLEFVAGIPGSVGGAVVMNAGAWGQEIGSLVKQVTVIDEGGNLIDLRGDEIPFQYRSWGLGDQVAARVTFRLKKGTRPEIEATCHDLARRRRETQPLDKASAGSFFKNPATGPAAGKLIADAGLKGRRVGDAMVSPKHANFLINVGEASAQDFLQLMRIVQEEVMALNGVWLEPEVRIIGEGHDSAGAGN